MPMLFFTYGPCNKQNVVKMTPAEINVTENAACEGHSKGAK
jgi:hypothetical protein